MNITNDIITGIDYEVVILSYHDTMMSLKEEHDHWKYQVCHFMAYLIRRPFWWPLVLLGSQFGLCKAEPLTFGLGCRSLHIDGRISWLISFEVATIFLAYDIPTL